MPRVLVSDILSEKGLEILRSTPGLEVDYKPGLSEDDLAKAVVGYDALVVRSGSKITEKVIESSPSLRLIGRAGIGVENIDVEAASKRGIIVMNTPTGNAVTTAEHTLSLLFALARRIPQADAALRAGRWERGAAFQGHELAGKTLGVVGLGNVGRMVVERAKALRMNVIVHDPVLTPERAATVGVHLVPLEDLWAWADAITVHTPLSDETRHLVDDDAIASMKRGVLLVNCARGGIFDEAAILRGLESGQVGGVALDVFEEEPPRADHPLFKRDDVVVTPHLGANTEEALERVASEIADQVVAYFATGTIVNAVNVPSMPQDVVSKATPYIDLANRLGTFIAQVSGLKPTTIEIELVGEPSELGAQAITASALAGVLARFLGRGVNQVSAPFIAQDRGIRVREVRMAGPYGRYNAIVGVKIMGEGGRGATALGTLGADGTARLVAWDGFDLEASLTGPTLVLTTLDRPGVVGDVGSVLGKHSINVKQIQLGMRSSDNKAVSLWGLAGDPNPALVEEIKRVADVDRAALVDLPR